MKLLIKSGIIVIVLSLFISCNVFENETNSSARLLVLGITVRDLQGTTGSTTVFSDVETNGSIINDTATAELTAVLLDPNAADPSYYQNVVVDLIRIRYSRSDGLAVEGEDVPYSFDQEVNQVIEIGVPLNLGFVLIQHTAKLESPLVELISLGQEKILKLEVEITFYSKDLAGNRLEPVTGSISVWCSNFADTE